jgi:CRISPR-associated endonuclease/helicase Cas3
MATANSMYERLGMAYRLLFGADQRPSLVLAHGARHLSDKFRNSVGMPESSPANQNYSKDEEPIEVIACLAADSRKKALFGGGWRRDVGPGIFGRTACQASIS